MIDKKAYIYESPDRGKTVFRREFGMTDREKLVMFGTRQYWVSVDSHFKAR